MRFLARNSRRRAFVAAATFCSIASVASAQSINDGFNPDVDNKINAVAIQSDGKMLVGGFFTHVGGQSHKALGRINADGTLDSSFNPVITGTYVYAIAVQSDGKILIGGEFSQVGASAEQNIARLNADGSVDTSFSSSVCQVDAVSAVAIQQDNKILFSCFASLSRVDSSGAVDASFTAPFIADSVSALLIQPDGKILIGGDGPHPLFRIYPNGAADTGFQFNIAGSFPEVNALALQPDGKIVIGGSFDTIDGNTQNNLARVYPDGSFDGAFSIDNGTGPDKAVNALAMDAGGNIYAAGYFTSVNGNNRDGFAMFDRTGTLFANFDPDLGTNPTPLALAVQSDNEIVVAGFFSSVDSIARSNIARVSANGGVLDDTLNLPVAGSPSCQIYAIASQVDGNLLVGGVFNSIGSTTRHGLARIEADGSVGPNYNPNVDTGVTSIAIEPDGSAIIGGNFSHVGGHSQANVAHLTAGGNVDTAFSPVVNAEVDGIALQPNGQILLSGIFSAVNGNPYSGFARLNPGGTLDATFNVALDGYTYALAVQADGHILIGGSFTHIGAVAVPHLVRLKSNGSLDLSFNADPDGGIAAISIQPDGKILTSGSFNSIGGQPCQNVARLNSDGSLDSCFSAKPDFSYWGMNVLSDGKILVTGLFTHINTLPYAHLARLNADGSLDTTFADLGADGTFGVHGAAVTRDGKIAVGGDFSHLGGQSHQCLARVSIPEAAVQSLNVNGNTVTWMRTGSSAAASSAPILSYSTDFATYAPLGAMTAIAGGWEFVGLQPIAGQLYSLKAQAPSAFSDYNDFGSGIIQYSGDFYSSDDDIFKNGFDL